VNTENIAVRLFFGLVSSAIIGGLAYRSAALSRSGVAGAMVVGTSVFGFGGWVWGATLIAFFVSSSALSRFGANRKRALADIFAKSSRRDAGQALANGGLAALIAVAAGLAGRDAPVFPILALAFYGALAAVNADTWATELGVLARQPPRLITTGRLVPTGASGGVTRQGILAALAGGAFIGLAAFILTQGVALITTGAWLLRDWALIPAAAVSGLAGALFDSVLGATVQAVYYCDACGKETERPIHRCGQKTRPLRGWPWLNNDWVNLWASLAGAVVAASLASLIF
jgi:uncharacterized protein (TIGR00297 family)